MTPSRLIFVTGKGGTGKSTVAAALATALSRRRPTTLACLDSYHSAAVLAGVDLAEEDSRSDGRGLAAVALSPRRELHSFIERIVPLKVLSRRMLKSRTFGYVTAALPGLEAFLLLERLRIMAGDAALEDRYVVVDAPACGGAIELLSVAAGVEAIAPIGTLNRLALELSRFLADATRFAVVLTVLPEDLALREALETAETLRRRLGVGVAAAIVNGVPTPLFRTAELAALSPFERHARLAIRRKASAERAARVSRKLQSAGLRTLSLPMLFTAGFGAIEVSLLSRRLERGLLGR